MALVVALVLTAVAVGVTLSRAPLRVVGTNAVPTEAVVASTRGNTSKCQVATVPQGTSGIRASIASGDGPRLRVKVLSGSRVIARGERAAGWGLEVGALVPISVVPQTIEGALICIDVGASVEPTPLLGVPTRRGPPSALSFKDVKLRLEYLRPAQSWWSQVSSIAYHMGLGHAASGTWLVFLVLALMIGVAVLAARLVLAELR
ncbi:MAG TPA: hypothetical protein VGX69_09845 [Solirubrobacteraceae bacterium]|nr:hypothetical protein [Solirubrobacteraceae bacterium]